MRLPPALGDSVRYFEEEFDWESNVTVVDLFSGAGGLSLGLDSTPGMRVVAALELDAVAAATHAANIRSAIITADVREVSSFAVALKDRGIRRVDVVAGGPPCQGFSRLGKGALRRLALGDGRAVGSGDDRNFLFREFIRAVRELAPAAVVMENVPEMAMVPHVVSELVGVLEDLGYRVHSPTVLAAADHGVPQIRRRLFVVATTMSNEFVWPRPVSARPTLGDARPVERRSSLASWRTSSELPPDIGS